MWRALGDPFLHFAIIRGAIQKGRLFSWIFCQFSPFRWSNFDLELIYFALSMNTSPYSPIASGTYNRWKVEFVLKTKMTKTSIQRRLWRNFIQRGLVIPIFIPSRSLLFEGNASLKCVYSGSSHITTVSGCYRKLNAHFYGAAWQKNHAQDTWHDTIPSQIILTLGRPVLALPRKIPSSSSLSDDTLNRGPVSMT